MILNISVRIEQKNDYRSHCGIIDLLTQLGFDQIDDLDVLMPEQIGQKWELKNETYHITITVGNIIEWVINTNDADILKKAMKYL